MRLSQQEIFVIKKILYHYSKEGKIFLHGSRIDNGKKGGDIDLFFVVPDDIYETILDKRIVIVAELSLNLHEQKIDLTCLPMGKETTHSFFKNSQKIKL